METYGQDCAIFLSHNKQTLSPPHLHNYFEKESAFSCNAIVQYMRDHRGITIHLLNRFAIIQSPIFCIANAESNVLMPHRIHIDAPE